MPFIVCDEVAKVVSESQLDKPGKSKGYFDMLQVFGGNMSQNIIEGVALLQESLQDRPAVLFLLAQTVRFRGFQFKYAAIGSGHDLLIDPISQPSAVELFSLYVGGHGDPGEYAPDIDIMGDIEVTEYLGDAPSIGGGLKVELIVPQT